MQSFTGTHWRGCSKQFPRGRKYNHLFIPVLGVMGLMAPGGEEKKKKQKES
jgi:hypothetical protein